MLFWIIALALAALGALPVLTLVLRGPRRARRAADMAIYRDQLSEIDRDLSRGVLSPDEAERTRAEVSRRLLDADRRSGADGAAGEAPRAARIAVAALIAGAVMAGGVALYAVQGAPGYPDLPLRARLDMAEERRATRPSQAEAEAQARTRGLLPDPLEPEPEFAALMERLRAAMKERPDDTAGWGLLAGNEARLGDYDAALRAQTRLVELQGDEATVEALAFLAELMVLNAGGFVTPEAEARLDQALARDGTEGRALYYKGLSHAQIGRPDRAFAIWRPLLERSTPDAPWADPIRQQIVEVAARAGIDYQPPSSAGPDADAIAAAGDMTPEARQEMIEGMVSGLMDRLASEGGAAPDWARLITALGVLGRTDRAATIADEARQVFAGRPDDLALIEDAANQAADMP